MALSPELELCYRCKERGHRAKVTLTSPHDTPYLPVASL